MEGVTAVESKRERAERVFLQTLKTLIKLEVQEQGTKRKREDKPPAQPVAKPDSVHTDCEVNVITGKACPVSAASRVKADAQTKHNGALLNVCKRCKLDLRKQRKSAEVKQ
jgi:hypothetical protein